MADWQDVSNDVLNTPQIGYQSRIISNWCFPCVLKNHVFQPLQPTCLLRSTQFQCHKSLIVSHQVIPAEIPMSWLSQESRRPTFRLRPSCRPEGSRCRLGCRCRSCVARSPSQMIEGRQLLHDDRRAYSIWLLPNS